MNFPGWNWKENTLKPNSTAPNLHTDFMDVLNNNALTQLVEEPTRQQNTLDLILTNHPGKGIRTDTIPSLTLVLFCGMCFTADFVIGYLAVIVLEHI
jgi:hypothetical protein